MDRTIRTGRRATGWTVAGRCCIILIDIGDILLRYSGEICYGTRERIGAAEGDYNSRFRWGMVQCYVAAGVGEQRTCIPSLRMVNIIHGQRNAETYSDQFKLGEIAATTQTLERFDDACQSNAIADVHDTGEFLELSEELRSDGAIGTGVVDERLLQGRKGGGGGEEDGAPNGGCKEWAHGRCGPRA